MAEEVGLDLVEVSPNSVPPVCRVMDYGKFRYNQSKKEREVKRKSTAVSQLREVRMTPLISENDLQIKTRTVKNLLLNDRAKVKISVMMRGRMIQRPQFGREILQTIFDNIKDIATIDKEPQVIGRSVNMVVSPLAKSKMPKQVTDSDPTKNGKVSD